MTEGEKWYDLPNVAKAESDEDRAKAAFIDFRAKLNRRETHLQAAFKAGWDARAEEVTS